MSQGRSIFPRRAVFADGAAGRAAAPQAGPPRGGVQLGPRVRGDDFEPLRARVEATSLVDTHEHLMEEELRLSGLSDRIEANDWSFLVSHYLDSELAGCGMSPAVHEALLSAETDPMRKWELLEPFWSRIQNTGHAQAVQIALRNLYGVDGLSRETVGRVQERYRQSLKPGFYRRILGDVARIESCQVSSLEAPFSESPQPTLLMQDISLLGMHMGPDVEAYARRPGIDVHDLCDWHRVIDWWFETFGPYAVAVTTPAACSRDIDFADVPPEDVESTFKRALCGDVVASADEKRLQDHLFWYCARRATEHNLPVKIRTGNLTGKARSPRERQASVSAAAELCRIAPDTRFVFMHISYPFHEDLIAVAKHHANCYIDMCWAWILSPVAATRFLMQYLVTAPANKVLTFGGDYVPVEPVVGHAALARRGITTALAQLVDEGWLDLEGALDLVDPIMRGNARALFDLERKTERLKHAPWL